MALDEIYDGYCIVCNHCSRYYRFDPRSLSAARGYLSFDEHGNPRDFVLKGKNMIAHWAKRDGWSSYLSGKGLPAGRTMTCHLCPYCRSLNDYGEVFD